MKGVTRKNLFTDERRTRDTGRGIKPEDVLFKKKKNRLVVNRQWETDWDEPRGNDLSTPLGRPRKLAGRMRAESRNDRINNEDGTALLLQQWTIRS